MLLNFQLHKHFLGKKWTERPNNWRRLGISTRSWRKWHHHSRQQQHTSLTKTGKKFPSSLNAQKFRTFSNSGNLGTSLFTLLAKMGKRFLKTSFRLANQLGRRWSNKSSASSKNCLLCLSICRRNSEIKIFQSQRSCKKFVLHLFPSTNV